MEFNSALEFKISSQRTKIDAMDEIPALFLGDEEELYEGEIKEIVIDILKESLKKQKNNSRRMHILADLIECNEFENIPERKKTEIKKI